MDTQSPANHQATPDHQTAPAKETAASTHPATGERTGDASATPPSAQPYDAVIIGGGPAGLQAALTLGRMHRSILLIDSGDYRNAPAHEMHNFITHDGTPPDEFRKAARANLDAYDTVEIRETTATAVTSAAGLTPAGSGWRIELGSDTDLASDIALGSDAALGSDTPGTPDASEHVGERVNEAGVDHVHARKLILATGLRDTLPDKPGLADLWGDVVAHCPFCHGHEVSGRHAAILGNGPHVPRLALMMSGIAARVTVLSDGVPLEDAANAQLAAAGIAVRSDYVTEVRRRAPGAGTATDVAGPDSPISSGSTGNSVLPASSGSTANSGLPASSDSPVSADSGATVSFAQGPDEEFDAIFVKTEMTQSAPFAEQLGLEMLPSGCVSIDEFGRTSRAGVYAAGDLAHVPALPMVMSSVLTAATAGLLAAAAVVQDLLSEDHDLPAAANNAGSGSPAKDAGE